MLNRLDRNVETFIGCDKEYGEADIVIFGAPYDSTTSFRPGARFGSKAIRGDSFGMETYSPYQNKDLCDSKVFDSGDLELPFGDPRVVLTQIKAFAKGIVEDSKIPVLIGGEHLVSLGAIEAVFEKHKDLHIIQLDAHADLREHYLEQTLSHATVMRRAYDLVGDKKLFQFGIRSGEREEFEFADKHTVMNKFNLNGLKDVVDSLKGKPVYVTIDLDVLDPSIFSGTGTPEAGGISFGELLEGVLSMEKLNIVGCDINELCPIYDQSGVSTAVACKVLRELLLVL